MKIVIGCIILIVVLVGYLGFSYLQNQKIKSSIQRYQQFRDIYGLVADTSMGYGRDSIFAKDVTIFLAADEEGKVIDAKMVTNEDGNIGTRSCDEYIGMDLHKYMDYEHKRSERPYIEEDPKNAKERAFDMAARKIMNRE